jgi:hypothetical protein
MSGFFFQVIKRFSSLPTVSAFKLNHEAYVLRWQAAGPSYITKPIIAYASTLANPCEIQPGKILPFAIFSLR